MWCHKHKGRGIKFSQIKRCGLWIVNGGTVVKRTAFKCFFYWKLCDKSGIQKMGDISVEITEEVSPFTHCGSGVFGQQIIRMKILTSRDIL